MRNLLRFLMYLFVGCCGLGSSPGAVAATTAVEYAHAGFGHHFVTASPQEIAALDAGSPVGWSRTGETFGVLDPGAQGEANVCRFWSGQSFAQKTPHFYTPFAAECALVKNSRDWVYEGEVFALALADFAGTCGSGTMPLCRLYNDGLGGAPNHRYTNSLAIRSQMRAQGWVAEGVGIGVMGGVPAPAPFTIVVAGDIGQCFDAPVAASGAAKTAALVTAQDARVLTAGDSTYELGAPAEFANRRRHRQPRVRSARNAAAQQRVPLQRELGRTAPDAGRGQLRLAVRARRWGCPDRYRHRDVPSLNGSRREAGVARSGAARAPCRGVVPESPSAAAAAAGRQPHGHQGFRRFPQRHR